MAAETQTLERPVKGIESVDETDLSGVMPGELAMRLAGRTALHDVTQITINKATGAIEESVKKFYSRPVEFPEGWD